MHDTTLLHLILMAIIHTALADNISPTCDMKQCGGYYKLKTHKIKKPNVEITKTKVKMVEGPEDVELFYVKRRWLTIYCYDGSAIDPNTGCYESIETKNPSCTDARRWDAARACPTGWECRPDGECKGDTATRRCYDSNTMVSNNGPTTLKWEGTRWMIFPMHTCVSSWECNHFKTSVTSFAKVSDSGKLQWVFYDKDNIEHEINKNFFETGYKNPTGEIMCITKEPPSNPKLYVLDAECYSESEENIKCLIKSKGEKEGLVFDVSITGEGVLRNMMIEVVGPLMVPKNGKLIDLNAGKIPGMPSIPITIQDRQRSVNIETAHELAINANVLQMQSLYNILTLSQEIDEVYNMIIEIVKSQSTDDPLLLSKVLGVHNFAVKWDNREIFEKCDCIIEPEIVNSNCMDGRMYSYGSYVEIDDTSKCFHIPNESIKDVSLMNKTNLNINTIKYLPPQPASSDSASWDALNDYRNKLVNEDRHSHSYESLEDKIGAIEEKMGIPKIKSYFIYFTYFLSWFSAVCIILNCRK